MLRSLATSTAAATTVLVAVAVAVAVPGSAPAVAGDEPTIEVEIEAPPSIGNGPEIGLGRGEDDVTEDYCTRRGTGISVRLSCAGLPDGDYAIVVGGLPNGASTATRCVDVVAARAERPTIGGGYSNWWCTVWIAAPGVILGRDGASVGDEPPLAVRTGSGEPAAVACEEHADQVRVWCTGLADGTYRAEAVDVPVGYRAEVSCSVVAPPGADAGGSAVFELSAAGWLWSCVAFGPEPDLRAVVQSWQQRRSWVEASTITVLTAEGTDIGDRCEPAELNVGDDFVERSFDCVGLADGEYRVSFSGIPDSAGVDQTCDPVIVRGVGSNCVVTVVDRPVSSVPDSSTPVGTLPATGRDDATGAFTAAAGALTLVGAGLVLLARRPPARRGGRPPGVRR